MAMATTCYGCGAVLRFDGPIGRRTTCPECDADQEDGLSLMGSRAPSLLSVAIGHLFQTGYNHDKKLLAFTDSVPNECREPHADHYIDKIASNACDLFQLGDGASHRRGSSQAARDRLGALFGEAPKPVENPRDALEALFRKS